ncbi:MAG: YybH family protein [Longimicrobiales bacterium]
MTPHRPLLGMTSFVFAVLSACSQPPAQPAPPAFGPEDQAAIRATTEAALAIANGSQDWDEYVAVYYAPDATVLPPNAEAVHGRSAISAFLASFPTITTFSAELVTVEGDGNLAYVHGTYHLEMSTPDGPQADDGKYIEVWKRQADGSWQIAYDIFNSNVPAM